jgi:hypothetical protein
MPAEPAETGGVAPLAPAAAIAMLPPRVPLGAASLEPHPSAVRTSNDVPDQPNNCLRIIFPIDGESSTARFYPHSPSEQSARLEMRHRIAPSRC